MSHYTVAVIVDKLDENEVAKMLAPYQENNMGNCPREYLAFNSITEEYKKTYEEGTRAMILIDDNKLVSEYDDMFKKEIVEEGHCFPTTTYEVPEKYRKVEIPYKLLYPTFDDFMKEYEGETKDEETNDYGYWENPNRKWDWYEIGGRWNRHLLVKEDIPIEHIGGPSWGNKSSEKKIAPLGYKWVNACRIKDLELEKMTEGKYEKEKRFWELKVEGQEPQNEEEKETLEWDYYKKEYYTERYSSKEEYAKWQSMFATFAMVDGRGWHEKGEMGWWGFDTSTGDSERAFIEKFNAELKNIDNQEKYIVLVDCHI